MTPQRDTDTAVKNWIKGSLAALMLVAATGAAVAQPGPPPGPPPSFAEQLDDMTSRLGLTEDQADAIAPILEESFDKRKAVMAEYGVTPGQRPDLSMRQMRAMGKKMKAIRKETNEQLAQHLSPDQMDTLEDIQKEQRERMRDAMRQRR